MLYVRLPLKEIRVDFQFSDVQKEIDLAQKRGLAFALRFWEVTSIPLK